MTDLDNPLDRCRVELGDPDATFSVGAGRFWAKLAAGVGLIAYGAAANYLWWVHGPQRFDHVTFLLLFAPPISGLSLLGHLYRTRGLHVLVYPTGLLRLQGGEVESYPWGEIDEVRLKTEKGTVAVDRNDAGEVEASRVTVTAPVIQIWKAAVVLRRADGVTTRLTPAVAGYADLAERVQRGTFPLLWPPARAAFRAGQVVTFGPFAVSVDGLRSDPGLLAWADVDEVALTGKNLTVKRAGKWMTWASKELDEVPNPHVLLALIDEARRTTRPGRAGDEGDGE